MADIREENKKHFSFELVHTDKKTGARAGLIKTPHGEIPTPVFMPVGTHRHHGHRHYQSRANHMTQIAFWCRR